MLTNKGNQALQRAFQCLPVNHTNARYCSVCCSKHKLKITNTQESKGKELQGEKQGELFLHVAVFALLL